MRTISKSLKSRAAGVLNSDAPKRCAIYTRKSTTKGLDQALNSIDAQYESCLGHVQRQPGWAAVSERYDDAGFTGANTDRPKFQELLTDISLGKIDIVIVYKVDRLSRSLLDFAKVMELFDASGVAFVSVTQNFSTADAMGRFTLNILMSFAEFEREMISERTRDKIAATRRRGIWTGGPIPFGYDVKDSKLVPNELEAFIVREAFELFLQHGQMAFVAKVLNERMHLPRALASRAGKVLRWTKDAVSRLLRSPLYAGLITYGKEQFKGVHQAIVDDLTFHRVRRLVEGRTPALHMHGDNPEYLLRGLLRCGLCSHAMAPAGTRKAGRTYRYYRCAERDKHGTCAATPLAAEAIEQFVVEQIAGEVANHGLAAEVHAAMQQRMASQQREMAELAAKLPVRIATLSASVAQLAESITTTEGNARIIVENRLRAESERLAAAERELANAQRALTDLLSVSCEIGWVTEALRDFGPVWEAMTLPNRGRLLRALIDRVEVDGAAGTVRVHLVDLLPERNAA